jgi:hypothetical protein
MSHSTFLKQVEYLSLSKIFRINKTAHNYFYDYEIYRQPYRVSTELHLDKY